MTHSETKSIVSSSKSFNFNGTRSRVSQRSTYPCYPNYGHTDKPSSQFKSSSAWKQIKSPFADSFGRRFMNRAISHRSFAVLFCYTGAILQTAYLTQIYFEYKTTTSVQILNPRQTDLPAISICFFYKIPGLTTIDLGNNVSQTSLTLGEINNRLPTWETFVKQCFVMDENYVFRRCDSISQEIAEFISLYSKCFTMFTNLTRPIVYSKEIIGSNRMVDFILNVSHSVITKVGVYLTHPSSELDEALGTPSFVYFETKYNNRATVSYQRTIIHSLPPPYQSRCFDYSQLPCKERRTCIKQCTLDKSYNESKGLINRRFTRIRPEVMDGRFGIRNHLDNHTSECNHKHMQVPCHEYLYQAIMGSEFESPFINPGEYRVSIDYPLGTETDVQYVPSRPFLDYVCFAASVLSLWTEISLIRLVSVSSKATLTFIGRKLGDKKGSSEDDIMMMASPSQPRSRTNFSLLPANSIIGPNSSLHVSSISPDGGRRSPTSPFYIGPNEFSSSRHRFTDNNFTFLSYSDKKNSR